MNDAGRIGFVIKGDYSNTETYDFLDIAYFNGATYVAKKLTVGNTPDNAEFWHILADGNIDVNDIAPTFLQAETRENINSGEKLPVIFGKIKKFFADLKTVAFTGSYNDLSNKPTASDLGLGNVDNTADADKNVKHAERANNATNDSKGRNIADFIDKYTGIVGTQSTTLLANLSNGTYQYWGTYPEDAPYQTPFIVNVFVAYNFKLQIACQYNGGNLVYRTRGANDNEWCAWYKVARNNRILNTATAIEASTSSDNIVGVQGLKEYLEANYVHK